MVQFLIKRFIGLLFVIIGVTFITFVMGYFAPGDPIRAMLGSHFDPVLYAQLKHDYGLDQPFFVQYWHFLTGLFRLDFGLSYQYQNQPVWDILKAGDTDIDGTGILGVGPGSFDRRSGRHTQRAESE